MAAASSGDQRYSIHSRQDRSLCVEAHDLAASKLAAYRPKDKEFVRQLLIEKMIDDKVLTERIGSLKIERQLRERLMRWVNVTAQELKHRE